MPQWENKQFQFAEIDFKCASSRINFWIGISQHVISNFDVVSLGENLFIGCWQIIKWKTFGFCKLWKWKSFHKFTIKPLTSKFSKFEVVYGVGIIVRMHCEID